MITYKDMLKLRDKWSLNHILDLKDGKRDKLNKMIYTQNRVSHLIRKKARYERRIKRILKRLDKIVAALVNIMDE